MFKKSAQFFNGCGRNPNWANFISTTYFLDFIEICFRVLIKHPFSCLRRETAQYFYENFVPTLIALLLWLNPFSKIELYPIRENWFYVTRNRSLWIEINFFVLPFAVPTFQTLSEKANIIDDISLLKLNDKMCNHYCNFVGQFLLYILNYLWNFIWSSAFGAFIM